MLYPAAQASMRDPQHGSVLELLANDNTTLWPSALEGAAKALDFAVAHEFLEA